MAIKAIKKLIPNLNIILADSSTQFRSLVPNVDKRARAVFMGRNNSIVINMETAEAGVIAHEIFHAIVTNKVGETHIINEAKRVIGAVKKALSQDKSKQSSELIKKLDKYAKLFEGKEVKNEEWVAELMAELGRNYSTLPVRAKSKIRQFIESIIRKLGLEKTLLKGLTKNETSIIKALNTISEAIRTGKEVKGKDVTTVIPDKVSKKETTKPIVKERRGEPTTIREALMDLSMTQGKWIKSTSISRDRLQALVKPFGYRVRKTSYGDYYLVGKGGIFNRENLTKTRLDTDPKERQSEIKRYIKDARDNNFTDTEIRDYLTKVQKYSKKEVDAILKKGDKVLLPDSFMNLKNDKNSQKGIRLYKRVAKYAMSLMERNKTRANPLTEAQMMDRVIEFLESQPQFKAEADTYKVGGETKTRRTLSEQQAKMQTEIQSLIQQRPTVDIQARLSQSRGFLRDFLRGKKTLSQVKTELRNFMRQTLPKDVYTKPEVMNLIKKIDRVTRTTLPGIMQEVIEFSAKKNVKFLEKTIREKNRR